MAKTSLAWDEQLSCKVYSQRSKPATSMLALQFGFDTIALHQWTRLQVFETIETLGAATGFDRSLAALGLPGALANRNLLGRMIKLETVELYQWVISRWPFLDIVRTNDLKIPKVVSRMQFQRSFSMPLQDNSQ